MTRTLLVPIYAPLPPGPLIQPVPDTVYIPQVSVEYISPLFIDFISTYRYLSRFNGLESTSLARDFPRNSVQHRGVWALRLSSKH